MRSSQKGVVLNFCPYSEPQEGKYISPDLIPFLNSTDKDSSSFKVHALSKGLWRLEVGPKYRVSKMHSLKFSEGHSFKTIRDAGLIFWISS